MVHIIGRDGNFSLPHQVQNIVSPTDPNTQEVFGVFYVGKGVEAWSWLFTIFYRHFQ
jgi:hypothetical protein